MAQKRETSVSI